MVPSGKLVMDSTAAPNVGQAEILGETAAQIAREALFDWLDRHDAALDLDGGFTGALTGRGLAYQAKGEAEKARTDFEAAIEEGSTLVRVGTAIFGRRTVRV